MIINVDHVHFNKIKSLPSTVLDLRCFASGKKAANMREGGLNVLGAIQL